MDMRMVKVDRWFELVTTEVHDCQCGNPTEQV